MIRSQLLFVLAGAALTAVSFPIAAQTSQPDRKDSDRATEVVSGDRALLAGPHITESETGKIASFGGRSRDRIAQVPPYRWFQLLRDIDLRPEQRETIVAIHSGFQEQATAFRQQHGRELRMIDQQRREARENGQDLSRDLIQRSREITADAPRPIQAQQKIWSILNDEQQNQFREILGVERTRMQERRRRDAAAGDAVLKDAEDRMTPENPAMKESEADAELSSQPDTPDPADSALEAARRASSRARADRRSRFLRAHQRSRQPGGLPAEEDKKFEFTDGER